MAIQGGRADERCVVPHLLVDDVSEAIEFYEKAFGAVALYEAPLAEGKLAHAQIQVFDPVILLTWERLEEEGATPEDRETKLAAPRSLGGSSVILEIYVDDVDRAFDRAMDAGASVKHPLSDEFYGDRYGMLEDPFGHVWALATVQETLSAEEVNLRARKLFAPA